MTENTYLSPAVRRFLIDLGKPFIDELDLENITTNYIISEELCLNWTAIENLFPNLDDNGILEKNPTWFRTQIIHAFPVYAEVHIYLTNHCNGSSVLPDRYQYCQWTGRISDIKSYIETKYLSAANTVEGILLFTSILERALGNVYLLRGKNVPFLLRDLLNTPEIRSIFGHFPVFFAQLLIGTPKALNLRNIVWHGFPRNDEIYPCYVSTLFFLISSFGKCLSEKHIPISSIPYRHQVSNLNQYATDLSRDNTFLNITPNVQLVRHILAKNKYINSDIDVWNLIIHYYLSNDYGSCVLILLPQFEHFLRKVYCDINNQSESLQTAESDTRYITLDNIFEVTVDNLIHEIFNVELLNLYNDVFTYQTGPRIRDKLSHGEINLADIPEPICSVLLCLVFCYINALNYEENDFTCFSNSYTSRFHPNATLYYNLMDLLNSLTQWETLPKPVQFETSTEICEQLGQFTRSVQSYIRAIYVKETPSNNFLMHVVKRLVIPTVKRPAGESEIVALLQRIINSCLETDKSLRKILHQKYELYINRKMRSRQRSSYEKMLQFVPQLQMFLESVAHIIVLYVLNMFFHVGAENPISYLKKILKCVENAVSNIQLEKNRWDSLVLLFEDFLKICDLITPINIENCPKNKI